MYSKNTRFKSLAWGEYQYTFGYLRLLCVIEIILKHMFIGHGWTYISRSKSKRIEAVNGTAVSVSPTTVFASLHDMWLERLSGAIRSRQHGPTISQTATFTYIFV
jgi:hypothetical protein